jgi:hypothetical protein
MAKQFECIEKPHKAFILRQKIFFTASAARDGRVNLSPKGLDCLRILGPNEVAYLDLTGSGNETSAHIKATGRVTMMFCAFEGPPLIFGCTGKAACTARAPTPIVACCRISPRSSARGRSSAWPSS